MEELSVLCLTHRYLVICCKKVFLLKLSLRIGLLFIRLHLPWPYSWRKYNARRQLVLSVRIR